MMNDLTFGSARFKGRLVGETQTVKLGATIGVALTPGEFVVLEGELGAGKTCFVRGAVNALGVPEEEPVTSPTFALVHEFSGVIPVVHADLYRLEFIEEVIELGLMELLGFSVGFIEWGERFLNVLGQPVLLIRLSMDGLDARHAEIQSFGHRGDEIVARVVREDVFAR